jgi:hypothetical protein
MIAHDDALNALARLDPRKVQVIEMRFFGGLRRPKCSKCRFGPRPGHHCILKATCNWRGLPTVEVILPA